MALEITKANFETLKAEDKLLVVDFWATWCGPCQMVLPIMETLSAAYEGRVNIGKCNVDEEADLPSEFGVRNIPTVLFFKGGELVDKLVGAHPEDVYKQKIESLL